MLKPEKINTHHNNKIINFFTKLKYSHSAFLKELLKNDLNIHLLDKMLKSGKIDINHLDENNQTFLHITLIKGKFEAANWLMDNNIGIDVIDIYDNTALHLAINQKNNPIIKRLLLINDKQLNEKNSHGRTLLQNAVIKGEHEIAEILLELGADINSIDNFGKNVMFDALSFGDESFIYRLLEFDNLELNDMFLNKETVMKHIEVTRHDELISNLTNRFILNSNNRKLLRAVLQGEAEQVTLLLELGANPNIQNDNNETVLFTAVIQGIKYIQIIDVLLKFGADASVKNRHNKTIYETLNDIILHTHQKKEIIDDELVSRVNHNGKYLVILKKILDYNKKPLDFLDNEGNPLFFQPFLYDMMTLFGLYINYGLDINTQNSSGYNLFYEYVYRVFKNNKENVEFGKNLSILLTTDIDYNLKDNTGWNVLNKVLSISKNTNLFKILVYTIEFDYYAKDTLGRTVIHTSIWFDNDHVIKSINHINSDIKNETDNYGILPIVYAALLGNKKLVLLLLSLNSNMQNSKVFSKVAISKFGPMVKNLDKLYVDVNDENIINKIDILVKQIKTDFNRLG